MNKNELPAPTATHNPATCPARSDGDGGQRPCTWHDHDHGHWADQATEDLQAATDSWKIS